MIARRQPAAVQAKEIAPARAGTSDRGQVSSNHIAAVVIIPQRGEKGKAKMQVKRLTAAQKKLLSAQGINHALWQLLDELPNTIIIKHRITGEIKVVEK